MEAETNIKIESRWSDRSESITKLATALFKAQSVIEAVKKDAANPFFKSRYADLATVWDAIREPLTANELSILQEPSAANGRVVLTTTLLHASGEYIRSSLNFPVIKQDPQGYGSAITYARRYALQSIVGIAPEEDDGNSASGKGADNTPSPKQKQHPQKANGVSTLGVGKYGNTPLTEVPADYLQKVFEDRRGPWELAEQELLRREAVQMQTEGTI